MTTRYAPTGGKTEGFFRGASRRKTAGRALFLLVILGVSAVAAVCLLNASRWIGKPFPGFFVNRRMVVSSTGLPRWTGTRSGLSPSDRIVAADRGDAASPRTLVDLARSRPVGDPVRYTVSREDRTFEVSVPTMRFSGSDLLMTFGVVFLHGIVYLALGALVFVLKPDTPVSWIFFAATSLQSVSSLVDFEVGSSKTAFSYVLLFCDSAIPALVVHFSAIFPTNFRFAERRLALAAPYLVSAILFLILVSQYPGPRFQRFYPGIYLYTWIAVFTFLSSLSFSYVKGRSVLARQRARVIFWGALLAFPFPLLAAVALNMGIHPANLRTFTNITAIPLLLFPVAVAYAIARHNLFDVDVYVKRAVGYAVMTAVVGGTYFALQVALGKVVLSPILGEAAEQAYPVIFALLVVFLFGPVNRRVQDGVDRVFFRKRFVYKDAVISVSEALSSVLKLDEIVHRVIRAVRKEMFIDSSGVIVLGPRDQPSRGFFVSEGTGQDREALRTEPVTEGDPLVALVTEGKRLVTKYDILEDPRYSGVRDACLKRFAELGATLAIPMVYQDEVKAVITVGHKKSGRFFTKEDVELLTTLASHGAVSIENAKLAERMNREEIVRTNLSRYLSPQVVDGIVKNDLKVNLGGARKIVTVLFSDIRNFTTITESRAPDQLVAILNEYFSAMAEVIFANGGSLDKYIGDAIVAVYGSLIPLEHPEENAVATAVGMMRRLDGLNRSWETRYGFSMTMGIGIDAGEVFLGNVGSPERMEFTVIGDTVNVASRFSGIARPGQILVTREVAFRLGSVFHRRELPPAQVKGKAAPLDVHEILYSHRKEAP